MYVGETLFSVFPGTVKNNGMSFVFTGRRNHLNQNSGIVFDLSQLNILVMLRFIFICFSR